MLNSLVLATSLVCSSFLTSGSDDPHSYETFIKVSVDEKFDKAVVDTYGFEALRLNHNTIEELMNDENNIGSKKVSIDKTILRINDLRNKNLIGLEIWENNSYDPKLLAMLIVDLETKNASYTEFKFNRSRPIPMRCK